MPWQAGGEGGVDRAQSAFMPIVLEGGALVHDAAGHEGWQRGFLTSTNVPGAMCGSRKGRGSLVPGMPVSWFVYCDVEDQKCHPPRDRAFRLWLARVWSVKLPFRLRAWVNRRRRDRLSDAGSPSRSWSRGISSAAAELTVRCSCVLRPHLRLLPTHIFSCYSPRFRHLYCVFFETLVKLQTWPPTVSPTSSRS